MGREKDRFEQILGLLPEGWEAKARELGALQRAREIKTPEALLRLILVYLTEGKSFAGTSALTRLSGEATLNKMAVYKRIRNSAAWLRWICEHIYRRAGLVTAKPKWLGKKNLCLIDGSEDVKCGIRRQCYRLHYSLDLFTLAVKELLVTDIRIGEKLANFTRFGKDDIVVADRIYGTLPAVSYLRQYKAGYILRLRARAFNIYNKQARRIELLPYFQGLLPGKCKSITAYAVINGSLEPVRICAVRKDSESERAGLKRLTKTHQRKKGGKPVGTLQQGYNKYIIVMTSLGKEVSTARVLELYRMRWQIELAFKRLKSLFHYNDIPSKQSGSALAWFYGKLLLAALCETLVNTGRFPPSGAFATGRESSCSPAAKFVEGTIHGADPGYGNII